MKIPFIRCALLVTWLLGQADISQAQSTSTVRRPNIIFILTDDQRFDAARALGTPQLRTPNLDKLVRQGTAFTHAHIMGSDEPAVCAPRRAMILTGQACYKLPLGFRSSRPNMPADTNTSAYVTFPEHFRQNGYYTYATGKWHNSRAAFAKSFSGGENLFFGGMHYEKDGGHRNPTLHHFDPYPPYSDWYDPKKVKLPPNFLPRHPFDNGELAVRDETLLPMPRTREAVQKEIADYYAMISEVDAQMGRILAEGWKLIRYRVNGQTTMQLFNLSEDPREQRDLSKEPRFQAILQTLLAQSDKEVQPLQTAQASR